MTWASDALVEGSLEWSFLTEDDLHQVAELRSALEYVDDPIEHRDLPSLVRDYHRDIVNGAFTAVVGRDRGGTIVAYAWNHPSEAAELFTHVSLDTGVHPAWRHRKIGHRLVQWSVAAAQRWHESLTDPSTPPLWIGYRLDEKFAGLGRALREEGFVAKRWFFDMHRLFDGSDLPELVPPDGVRIERYEPWMSELVRAAANEAFGSMPGARAVRQAEWEWSMGELLGSQTPSFVAFAEHDNPSHPRPDHGLVVGYAINTAYAAQYGEYGSEGWTARFGVCPAWRGNGVGTALIIASTHGFAEFGLDGAGLGVDTVDPEGAERLLLKCGFVSEDRMVLYALQG